jgi:hypothetical protein
MHPQPPEQADGERFERLLARVIVALATVGFALAAGWELASPLFSGHYASSASVGIIADNMLRWGIAGPVWEYTAARPSPSQYYCHHPWGIFWTTAALMKIFGRHDVVCRLAPVLLSSVTPLFVFLLGRALWRPLAGALAALAFVVLPISLSFASFNALEVPVIAWSTLGAFGYLRHQQTARRRYLALSLFGFGLALHADWPAYVLVGTLLAFELVRMVTRRLRAGPGDELRTTLHWWALTAGLATVTLGFYAYLFHTSAGLETLFASYDARSAGSDAPLVNVLGSRRYWLELMFTPLALVLMFVGLLVSMWHLARRETGAVVPPAVFVMAATQYLVFEQGADIHVFWPHYFALSFALGVGASSAAGLRIAVGIARRRKRSLRAAVAGVAASALVPLGIVARDGVEVLAYAHATGGRFNEKGLFIQSDGDTIAFLGWLGRKIDATSPVALHASMRPHWGQTWALGGRVVELHAPPARRATRPYLVDARYAPPALLDELLQSSAVSVVGPFWYVHAGSGFEAFTFAEREPSWRERYLTSGSEPIRDVVNDPFRRWEVAAHFGSQGLADEALAEVRASDPGSFEQRRIAHNAALVTGNGAAAEELFAALSAELDAGAAPFAAAAQLVGTRLDRGIRPTLQLLFRCARPLPPGVVPRLTSQVIQRPPWSTTMADPTTRELAPPPDIAPSRWRPGFLYGLRVPLLERPGTEIFTLTLGSQALELVMLQ